MSYEIACEQLYNERLAQKAKLQVARDKFRQSVLDRQNKPPVNIDHNVLIRTQATSEVVTAIDFVMPVDLPAGEDQLKWLIFQNIELIQKVPDRKKEAQDNIKRIKTFVNEQKALQPVPA